MQVNDRKGYERQLLHPLWRYMPSQLSHLQTWVIPQTLHGIQIGYLLIDI